MNTQKYIVKSIEEVCEYLEELNHKFMPLVKSELQVQSKLSKCRGRGLKRTQRLFVHETFTSQVNSLIKMGQDILTNANMLLNEFKDADFATIEEYVSVLSESRVRCQESGIATNDMLNLIHQKQ